MLRDDWDIYFYRTSTDSSSLNYDIILNMLQQFKNDKENIEGQELWHSRLSHHLGYPCHILQCWALSPAFASYSAPCK